MPLPPVPSDRDSDHLRLLAIFHFIYAGLSVLGIGFLFIHYSIMRMVFNNPRIMDQMRNPPNGQPLPFDPQVFFQFFIWFYVFAGVWIAITIALNVAAGLKLQARKSRTFVLVVAGLNCLGVPFGTALGIFTIVVLTRDSVRTRFDANATAAWPPPGS